MTSAVQAKRARWIAAGCCPRCGIPVRVYRTCTACRARDAQNWRTRQARKPPTPCTGCGRPHIGRTAQCPSCANAVGGRARCAGAVRHPMGYLIARRHVDGQRRDSSTASTR